MSKKYSSFVSIYTDGTAINDHTLFLLQAEAYAIGKGVRDAGNPDGEVELPLPTVEELKESFDNWTVMIDIPSSLSVAGEVEEAQTCTIMRFDIELETETGIDFIAFVSRHLISNSERAFIDKTIRNHANEESFVDEMILSPAVMKSARCKIFYSAVKIGQEIIDQYNDIFLTTLQSEGPIAVT